MADILCLTRIAFCAFMLTFCSWFVNKLRFLIVVLPFAVLMLSQQIPIFKCYVITLTNRQQTTSYDQSLITIYHLYYWAKQPPFCVNSSGFVFPRSDLRFRKSFFQYILPVYKHCGFPEVLQKKNDLCIHIFTYVLNFI